MTYQPRLPMTPELAAETYRREKALAARRNAPKLRAAKAELERSAKTFAEQVVQAGKGGRPRRAITVTPKGWRRTGKAPKPKAAMRYCACGAGLTSRQRSCLVCAEKARRKKHNALVRRKQKARAKARRGAA